MQMNSNAASDGQCHGHLHVWAAVRELSNKLLIQFKRRSTPFEQLNHSRTLQVHCYDGVVRGCSNRAGVCMRVKVVEVPTAVPYASEEEWA